VELPDAGEQTQVRVLTDLPAALPVMLERETRNRFSTILANCEGRFTLRLALSRDGVSWGLDAAEATRVLVRRPVPLTRCYSLLPTASGTICAWRERLDVIQQLGFDTVHVLPVTHMDASGSPYSAYDLFHVDPRYARTPEAADAEFASFVDDLRRRGMRLCVDLVFNHIGINSKLAIEHPEWLETNPDEEDGIQRAGWSDGTTFHKWTDLAKLNYRNPVEAERDALFETMAAYGLHWAAMAATTDGLVRLDNLHSSDSAFMTRFLDRLHCEYPQLLILAEMFAMPAQIREHCWSYGVDMLLATPWEHPFVPRLRHYIQHMHDVAPTVLHHIPLTSHDAGSPAEEFGSARASIPRYLVSALCGFGCTGITQGTEQGLAARPAFIGFTDPTEAEMDPAICSNIREMNLLLAEHVALRTPGNLRFVDNHHDAVIAAWREGREGGASFLLIANFDTHHEQTIDLTDGSLPDMGVDIRSGATYRLQGAITLEPCGVRIFRV